MRGATLLTVSIVCAVFWAIALIWPIYVGAAALILALTCCGVWLFGKVRQAFTFASSDLADFVSGKDKPKRPDPIIPYNLKDPKTGRFISRKAAMRAALEHAVGMK